MTWPTVTVLAARKAVQAHAAQLHGHRGADSWVAGIGVDAASVAALGDLDVAVVSPALSPRVLHLERVAVIADGKDTVIKVGAAAAGEDTARVHLERHLVSLNGNRHWSVRDGGLQGVGALADALVAGDSTLGDGGGVRRLAGTVAGGVWVGGFSCHVDTPGEVEGKLHAAAVAACILGGAIDKLLLGHGCQRACSDLPSTLH